MTGGSPGPVLVLATANPAKAAELRALLADLPYRIETLADHPAVRLPPEGATSYADNARAKARAAARQTGRLAVADDSGLEVDALDGGPGVTSARYGGPGLTDAERVDRLLAAVAAVAAAGRAARFRCVLAAATPAGAAAVAEGVVEGEITHAPRGRGGFGYDPIFEVPALGRTFAELPAGDKARWSHRGKAAAGLRATLADWARRPGPEGHAP